MSKAGQLQVWWVPQVPMKAFTVPVANVEEGAKILDVLADYDKFQLDNNIKPDYCNAGGLQVWEDDCDGDGNPGWSEWHNDDGEDICEVGAAQRAKAGT